MKHARDIGRDRTTNLVVTGPARYHWTTGEPPVLDWGNVKFNNISFDTIVEKLLCQIKETSRALPYRNVKFTTNKMAAIIAGGLLTARLVKFDASIFMTHVEFVDTFRSFGLNRKQSQLAQVLGWHKISKICFYSAIAKICLPCSHILELVHRHTQQTSTL